MRDGRHGRGKLFRSEGGDRGMETAQKPDSEIKDSNVGAPWRRFPHLSWVPIAFFAYLFVIRLRFYDYDFATLAGDDIYLLGMSNEPGGYNSRLLPSLLQHSQGKWRPVTQIALSPLLDIFSGDFRKYQIVNEVLLAACGTVIAVLVLILTNRRLLGFLAGFFAAFTHFALFHVLQVFGLMECLAVLFTSLSFLCLALYGTRRQFRFIVLANVFLFLAIHSHERFLFALPGVVVLTFLLLKDQSWRQRTLWGLFPILIFLENFLIKSWIFDMKFLTGGGGSEINSTTTDVPRFMVSGLQSILGYHVGPDYLSGGDARNLGLGAVIFGGIWGATVVFVVLRAAIKICRDNGIAYLFRLVVISSSILIPLLLSASITFRQEFRWLLAPYLCLVVISFVAAARAFSRGLSIQIAAVCLLIAGVTSNLYYARYATRTYFFETQELADSIKVRLIDQYSNSFEAITFVVVTYDTAPYKWAVGGGYFFKEYASDPRFDLREIPTFEQLSTVQTTRKNIIVFENRNREIVQVAMTNKAGDLSVLGSTD
jgi:hypothetical protein